MLILANRSVLCVPHFLGVRVDRSLLPIRLQLLRPCRLRRRSRAWSMPVARLRRKWCSHSGVAPLSNCNSILHTSKKKTTMCRTRDFKADNNQNQNFMTTREADTSKRSWLVMLCVRRCCMLQVAWRGGRNEPVII